MFPANPNSITKTLKRQDGTITYDDTEGTGRPVVFVPGMGDLRQSTRFVTPLLHSAGYRVITMDIRGHGESSTTFKDYTAAAVGSDVVALLNELNLKNAIVSGNSMAAGSAVWAAAEAPGRITGLALTGAITRDMPMPFGVKTGLDVALWRPWGNSFWSFFYKSLYKTHKPADFDAYHAHLVANLRESGRLAALQQMMAASKSACAARYPEVKTNAVRAVVINGTLDPDFPDPKKEAEWVAGRLQGKVEMVEGAGHYPHVEFPEQFVEIIRNL